MSFFDFFKGKGYPKSTGSVAEDMNKIAEDLNNVVKFPEPKALPYVAPKKVTHECYRIGYDEHAEMVSLTVIGENGLGSITLRMNYPAAQHMIKMINTAFPEYDPELDDGNV